MNWHRSERQGAGPGSLPQSWYHILLETAHLHFTVGDTTPWVGTGSWSQLSAVARYEDWDMPWVPGSGETQCSILQSAHGWRHAWENLLLHSPSLGQTWSGRTGNSDTLDPQVKHTWKMRTWLELPDALKVTWFSAHVLVIRSCLLWYNLMWNMKSTVLLLLQKPPSYQGGLGAWERGSQAFFGEELTKICCYHHSFNTTPHLYSAQFQALQRIQDSYTHPCLRGLPCDRIIRQPHL